MKTVIQTPTGNQLISNEFYRKLNFTPVDSKNSNILTDGQVIIEINPEKFARLGIKLFKQSWQTEVEALKLLTEVSVQNNMISFCTPSGMWVYLIEKRLQHPDLEDFNLSALGNNTGISLESHNLALSVKLFETIGFEVINGSKVDNWIALKNENNLNISLMSPFTCPHLFFNPSLTFFNGKKNMDIIKKIRTLNIPITEEITAFNPDGKVDNIIIRDPGGLGFFIFND